MNQIATDREQIRTQVIEALAHPEAEEGLYFENLTTIHEDEDRIGVVGNQEEILDVLRELIDEGRVNTDDSGERVIFYLVRA